MRDVISPILSAIIVMTPLPAHWDATVPMTWRFVGHPGPSAQKAITVGMFPLFREPCDARITVHLAGRGQTMLLLYPQTAGVLILVTDDKGVILSADISVNWRTKRKDMSKIVARMVAILNEPKITMRFLKAW